MEKYTLEDFLIRFNYSKKVKDLHVYPMISSIWSCDKDTVKKFNGLSQGIFTPNKSATYAAD